MTLLLLVACDGKEPQKHDDTGPTGDDTATPVWETACDDAAAMLGYRACVPAIADEDTFSGVTIASSSADQLRVGAGQQVDKPPVAFR